MSLLRGAALAGVAGAVLASLTFGAALPASAADNVSPLFPSASNAADYALSVRGMDIYAAQSEAARAAWGPEMARVAAKDANIYRAAQVYGTIDPTELGEVIPINKAVDQAMNGKLTKGMLVTNGPKGWVGKGFRFPSFPSGVWAGVRTGVGLVGLTAAMYGWEKRADIAQGVVSWVGTDAAGAVCSDPVAGGHNVINWITGQDCDQWAAGRQFEANKGVDPTVTWGRVCETAHPSSCVTFNGLGVVGPGQYSSAYCWSREGYSSADSTVVTIQGFYGTNTYKSDYGSQYIHDLNGSDACAARGGNSTFNFGNMIKTTGYWITNANGDTILSPVATSTSAAGDPPRVIRCTQYGPSGNVTNGYTQPFRQSTLLTGGSPEPVCVPLPNGETQNRIVITQIDPDGETVLKDQSETPAAGDFRTKYSADCGTGAAQRTCLLDVVQIGNGISCFSSTATCTDWFHDPQRDSKYQCQFGGKNEPVQQCAILANTFDAAKRAAGNPYADPLTGDDLFSGTGADQDTMTMGNPAGSAIQPNGEVASCYGGNSPGAFNPISWIVRGGQCLLNWAFVPRPLVVQSRMAVVSSNWEANGIGKLVTAVGGWHISPVVSGCSSNLPFPVPMIHQTITVPIIQACPGTPMGDFAPWVRGLVSAGLIITAGFAVKRIVSGWLPA